MAPRHRQGRSIYLRRTRLQGIAPEGGQPYGNLARHVVSIDLRFRNSEHCDSTLQANLVKEVAWTGTKQGHSSMCETDVPSITNY